MKKLFSILLSVCMILTVFTSCGSSKGPELNNNTIAGSWHFDFSGVDKDKAMDAFQVLTDDDGMTEILEALGADTIIGLMNDITKYMVCTFNADGTYYGEIDIKAFSSAFSGMIRTMYTKLAELPVSEIADLMDITEEDFDDVLAAYDCSGAKEFFDMLADEFLAETDFEETFTEIYADYDITDGKARVEGGTYKIEGDKLICFDTDGEEEVTLTCKFNGFYIEFVNADTVDDDSAFAVAFVKGARLVKD